VIQAWQRWAPDGPDELAASLLVTVDGAIMFGTMLGPEPATAALLGDFVTTAGAEPLTAVTRHSPFHQAKRDLERAGAPVGATYLKSGFFDRPLPGDAITALVEDLGGGPARELDFMPWGGAYNRVPAPATAFAHRDARFLLKHSVTVRAGDPAAARRWLARSHASVREWGTGGVYPNFPDPDLTDWATAYHGANYPRLQRVKARYDPDGFFRFHQAIRA
jgi:FAD/FMN-containing dehydrogenase